VFPGRPKVIGNTHGVDDIKQRNTQTVVGKAALLKIPVYLMIKRKITISPLTLARVIPWGHQRTLQ
jgi:hypothetical protein